MTTSDPIEELAKDVAIDWLLRQLYAHAAITFAPKRIQRDPALPEEAKRILLHRVEIIEGKV